jgi:hypothetical protein
MENLFDLLRQRDLFNKSQAELDLLKRNEEAVLVHEDLRLYTRSLYRKEEALFFIAMTGEEKFLFVVSRGKAVSGFTQSREFSSGALRLLRVPMIAENLPELQELFPFTKPVSLRNKRTTVGCGDRLGMASAAHIRAVRQFDAYPVLAQQSIRELKFCGRSFADVVADAAFQVFQEGYEEGWGADGDHLKTMEDIDSALEQGMPMITLDLTEVLHPEAADFDDARMNSEFAGLDSTVRDHVLREYADRKFKVGNRTIGFDGWEAKKCALMYWDALEFAAEVDAHLRAKRGDAYDLEISIDETTSPTLPAHHLFIIRELQRRNVTVNSLAPRFIGEFQKAVDYIGDVKEFEEQFKIHCDIAAAHGNYKISIHSGSDKFSVYPVIGKYTKLRLHLKTAGTSWLEAVRTIAETEPELYRLMHSRAKKYFPEALKSYHITADLNKIPPLESTTDDRLADYMNQPEARQFIHISYGGLLNDPDIREPFFSALKRHEDTHYRHLYEHFTRHLKLLGLEPLFSK